MKKYLVALFSGLLCLLVFNFVDLNGFYSSLVGFSLATIAGVFFLFVFNALVVIFRYWRILQHFGYFIRFADVVRASVSGNIASLLMIPLVGQVAGRQVMLDKAGISAAENAAIAAYERFVVGSLSGLLALLGGFYIFSSTINEYIKNIPLLEIFLIVLVTIFIYLSLAAGRFERLMLSKIFSLRSCLNAIEVYFITLLSSAIVLSSFYMLFGSVLPEVGFLSVLSAAAVVSFLAGLPVSFGGWGLREVSSVYVLSVLGGTSASALAASILLGLISTAAVLILFPLLLIKSKLSEIDLDKKSSCNSGAINVEDTAVWILTLMVGVLVFFQLHVQVGSGYLNVNLADPFAILIFSIVLLDVIIKRELPRWRLPNFNVCLLLITLTFILSYGLGVYSFGSTGWASGKLIGWLVLLGYLFSGYLTVKYFKLVGFFKLLQLMVIAVAVILVVNIVMWVLFVNGVMQFDNFHYILEAYSGNRNALAFQVLVVLCLSLAFDSWYARLPVKFNRVDFFSLSVAVMIAAVLITASRSAIVTMFIVLAVSFFSGMVRRYFLAKVAIFGFLIFITAQYGVYFFNVLAPSYFSFSAVGSSFSAVNMPISSESSDLARWGLIVESFVMWRDNPFFGAGLGAFYYNSLSLMGFSVVVHNTSLWLLAEFGLFGFIVFLSPFLFILKYAIWDCKVRVVSNALILLLLMFAVMSMFHEVFYQRMFWLALGGLIALPGVRKGLA